MNRVIRLTLAAALGLGISLAAASAPAADNVQLTYGDFQSQSIPLTEVEAFAVDGTPSQAIQDVLDILQVDPAAAQDVLNREIPLDLKRLQQMADTFLGQAFLYMMGTAVSLGDSQEAAWRSLQEALEQAAADERISLLEVLQQVETPLLQVDARQALSLAAQVAGDLQELRELLAIVIGP